MGFKKSQISNLKSLLFFSLLLLAVVCRPVFAEGLPEDPADLNAKSTTELIAAEREIKERLQHDPANADLYFELSEVYSVLFDRTRTKSAQSNEWIAKNAEALEKAVMIKPNHKTALYNLGVVYKRQGKMERAREELRKAMRACDPDKDGYLLFAIWMQIGSIYEEQGFYDEAKEAYEKALDYDYGNDDARNALLDLKAKKASDVSASSYNVTPGMSMLPFGTASAKSYDPMSGADMRQQGLEQVMPALGSMLSKKMGDEQSGSADNDQQQ
jgi:tetratricopeptide (TPR) repeat protein